jgi:hypothetical protein
MSDKTYDIPAIDQSVDPKIRNPMVRMREALQTLLSLRGDGTGAAITIANGGGGNTSTTIVVPGGGTGGGGTTPDLTPPPSVTGLSAVAGFTEVIVTWDAATYTQGHGHGQTNIYAAKRAIGAALPTFSDAVQVYEATGALTIAALPSELNTRWHLWAKWQTADGVESTAPAGGTNGVTVTTGQDITQLLSALTGSITESQMYASLGARINLIDGSSSLAGSVAQRVLAEATARGTAIATETASRTSADNAIISTATALAATVASNTAAISTEASVRASADGNLFAQYTVKLDVNGYVSGYGLASTSSGAAPTSSFIVRADSFAISSPSGPGISPSTPFIVRTTITNENGVNIPAGVYMDSAYIVNVSAMYARFGTLIAGSIAVGQINAANLTLGTGVVGGNLRSTNYVTGSTGWIVRPDGYAEFSNVVVRGTVYASGGTFAGDISAASGNFRGSVTGGAISSYAWPAAGSGPGFYLGGSGLLLGNANDGKYFQVDSSGNVYAPGFSIINGAAKFSSVAVGAVNTVNIVPGAVTGSGRSGEITMSYAPTSFSSFNTGAVGLYYLVTTGANLLLGAVLAVDVSAAPSGFYLNVSYWLTIDGVNATTDPQASFSNIQSTTANKLYFSSSIVGLITGVAAGNHLFGFRAVVSFTNNAGSALGMAYANFTIKASQYTMENKV